MSSQAKELTIKNISCTTDVSSLIQSVLSSHPSIESARYLIQSSNAQVEGAKWGYYPTPSVDASMASGRRGTTIRLDQPVWTGGKLDAAYNLALSYQRESEITLEESRYVLADTLLSVLRNYVQAKGNLAALEEGKQQLRSFESMLERRIEAGVSSLADRELIRSRLAQIDADIASARARKETAWSQIELMRGSALGCGVTFEDQPSMTSGDTLTLLQEAMIQTHPSLKHLSAKIRIAEAERDKARSAPWPNVSLRAEHQSGSIYTDERVTNNLLYVAVQASPGAGLSAMSAIQNAEAKVLQSQSDKQIKERELSDAMLRDYDEYITSKRRIEGMNETIDAAQNVLDSYTRLFVAGKRQWLDLVNSSRELTQNNVALSDLKAYEMMATYRIALKSGKLMLSGGQR